ncbi:hypothetical protein [Streptomyces sp. NBC_01320]|uniref:hypothetical protein n=1 Tax=Streptomyces sp. NBC_01320 TaxID=2903824 RepID=UPI002E11510D|nr:hypothetical protein OG395_57505 [Streptomyces sp. NBC_01320]
MIEAEAALEAYLENDKKPLFDFMVQRLKLRRPSEDHAQALMLALLCKDWKHETDLSDPRAVRLALRKLTDAGEGWEANHQVAGGKITSLEDLQAREVPLPPSRTSGPEEFVIANLVPWAESFDNRHVRHAVARLDQAESAVTRRWAEETFPNWREAVLPHEQQAPEFSDRVRRKLRRHGKEIIRRQSILGSREEA